MDGVAGAVAAPRTGGARRGPPRARARDAVLPIPAVDRRRAVARRARRRARSRRRAVWRPAVHGRRRQRRRVGAPGEFRLDMSVGVPPDAFSATGQDWGMPAYRWDVHRRRRLRAGCATARGAAPRSTTAIASITGRLLPDLLRGRATAASASFTPADEPAQLALGERCWQCSASPAPRSSPRISGPFPISCARRSRAWGSRGSVCSAGNAVGHRPGSRSATPPIIRRCRSRRPARTTPSRSPSGGRTRQRRSARRSMRLPTIRRVTDGAGILGASVQPGGARRAARGAVRVGFGPVADGGPGRVRLA